MTNKYRITRLILILITCLAGIGGYWDHAADMAKIKADAERGNICPAEDEYRLWDDSACIHIDQILASSHR